MGNSIVGRIGLYAAAMLMVSRGHAAREPNTLYYMAVSGAPTLTPVEHPPILARSAEDSFDPGDESRTSGD